MAILKNILQCTLLLCMSIPAQSQDCDSLPIVATGPSWIRQSAAPAALMAAGIFTSTAFKSSIRNRLVATRNEHFGSFHTALDNYLQYSLIPIAYGMDLCGVTSKHDPLNRSIILLKGEALMFVSVNILKYTTREMRPDGSNPYSFPSGHTAQAFAAATFLSEEYKDRFPWMPYAAYSVAGVTGVLRMANNRHYIGDVLMGAGLGILSMKVAYFTHRYHWGKRNKRYHYH